MKLPFDNIQIDHVNELVLWFGKGIALSLGLNLLLLVFLAFLILKTVGIGRRFREFTEKNKSGSDELPTQISNVLNPSISSVSSSLQNMHANLVEKVENLKSESKLNLQENLGQIRDRVARDLALNRQELGDVLNKLRENLQTRVESMQKANEIRLESIRKEVDQNLQLGRKEASDIMEKTTKSLVDRFEKLQQSNEQKLEEIRKNVETRLTESLEKSGAVFQDMTKQIGDLKSTNERIVEISKDINSLTEILASPKPRGNFGEIALENMLRQVVPQEHYDVQVDLGGAKVDAVIRLKEGLLCIDSKFPLDYFRRSLEDGKTEEEKGALLKQFHASVKGHVDDISRKYILPEKTLDFAFMFIPAENVYYEILLNSEIHPYALGKNVIPVSPNTLYAYLQALAIGFRGLKIEQEAKRIEQTLLGLKINFDKFKDHFRLIGKHIENARTQFVSAERDVDRFDDTIGRLKMGQTTQGSLPSPDNSNGSKPDDGVPDLSAEEPQEAAEDANPDGDGASISVDTE